MLIFAEVHWILGLIQYPVSGLIQYPVQELNQCPVASTRGLCDLCHFAALTVVVTQQEVYNLSVSLRCG